MPPSKNAREARGHVGTTRSKSPPPAFVTDMVFRSREQGRTKTRRNTTERPPERNIREQDPPAPPLESPTADTAHVCYAMAKGRSSDSQAGIVVDDSV